MAALTDNNKIIVPFMPTLLHIARVKVAAPLLHFDLKTLESAFAEIQSVNSTESKEAFEENGIKNYNTVKEKLLDIPGHLRKSVLEAVNGMKYAVRGWRDVKCLLLKHRNHTLRWKSDGTIDTFKIAKELVLNGNIDIKERFIIASRYCFVKEIQTLWVEIEASGIAESFEVLAFDPMIRFWLRWMRGGAKGPWIQAAAEHFEPQVKLSIWAKGPKLSSFFPLLQPEDRQKFFKYFRFVDYDDLRYCLYEMTKEEEEQILKEDILVLLSLYLDWPLQCLFLETVEKAWNYINEEVFRKFIFILNSRIHRKDFDYCGLLTDFWYRSPTLLRERVEKDPCMKIHLDKIKRKAVDDGIQKKKMCQTPMT